MLPILSRMAPPSEPAPREAPSGVVKLAARILRADSCCIVPPPSLDEMIGATLPPHAVGGRGHAGQRGSHLCRSHGSTPAAARRLEMSRVLGHEVADAGSQSARPSPSLRRALVSHAPATASAVKRGSHLHRSRGLARDERGGEPTGLRAGAGHVHRAALSAVPVRAPAQGGRVGEVLFGGKNVDVERMPVGIEVMPSQQEALDGFSMSPATAA